MKRIMKKLHTISSMAVLGIVFIGCGGGGGSSSLPEENTTTLTGTVPGTLIEVYCIDGTYNYVNSVDNGTSNHPFEIEVPKGIDCKLVMTTNENDSDISKRIVTPIQLSNAVTTSTYFNLEDSVDIGYVGLSTTGQGIQPLITVEVFDEKMNLKEYTYDPLDLDNDGIPNAYEDDDNDGKYNKDDELDETDEESSDSANGNENDEIDETDEESNDSTDVNDETNEENGDSDDVNETEDEEEHNETEEENGTDNGSNATADISLPTVYTKNDGRLLASQCFQCHGTNGVSTNNWDSIAGEDEMDEVFGEDAIMDAQAHGYTTTELNLIGSYLKTLSKYDD